MYFNQSNEDIAEDENKCHICDIEFEQLELHFLTSHTSRTILDDINKEDEEAAPAAGDDAGLLEGDQALDGECQDELDTPEAGHQVGGDQLQRPGQGREGEEAGHRQSCR